MPGSNTKNAAISVMLVDDHQMLLDLWVRVLSAYENINVIQKATDGEMALSYCEKLHPEIVLLDINIGKPDGFETTKLIRKNSPGSRVIGVSMFTQIAYVKKLLRSGASGYVTKSSEAEELINAIYQVKAGATYLCKQIVDCLGHENVDELKKDDPSSNLTLREIEIIQLIQNGDTSKEIAEKLFLTPKTVELHRYNILHKLNIKNTAALIAFAHQHCL